MTPYERDPQGDFAFLHRFLHREIGPRLSPKARERWRRVGAFALAASHLLGLGALAWLVWYRVGLPAAIAYALVVAVTLRLTWHRVSGGLTFAAYALFLLSVVAFVVLMAGLGDESDPVARREVARATLTWRTAAGLLWLVQWPPATIRRLWHRDPGAIPS